MSEWTEGEWQPAVIAGLEKMSVHSKLPDFAERQDADQGKVVRVRPLLLGSVVYPDGKCPTNICFQVHPDDAMKLTGVPESARHRTMLCEHQIDSD